MQQQKLQKKLQSQKLKHNTQDQFNMLNNMAGFVPGKAGAAISCAQALGVDQMIAGALHDGARSDVNSAKAAVLAKGAMNLATKQLSGGMMGMGGGLGALSNLSNLKQEYVNVQAGMAKAERRFQKMERKQQKQFLKNQKKIQAKKQSKNKKSRK